VRMCACVYTHISWQTHIDAQREKNLDSHCVHVCVYVCMCVLVIQRKKDAQRTKNMDAAIITDIDGGFFQKRVGRAKGK